MHTQALLNEEILDDFYSCDFAFRKPWIDDSNRIVEADAKDSNWKTI